MTKYKTKIIFSHYPNTFHSNINFVSKPGKTREDQRFHILFNVYSSKNREDRISQISPVLN